MSDTKHVVLIHGSWSRGEQFAPARAAFEERGYTAHTPTLRHHELPRPRFPRFGVSRHEGPCSERATRLETPERCPRVELPRRRGVIFHASPTFALRRVVDRWVGGFCGGRRGLTFARGLPSDCRRRRTASAFSVAREPTV